MDCRALVVALLVLAAAACSGTPSTTIGGAPTLPAPSNTAPATMRSTSPAPATSSTTSAPPAEPLRMLVIGDFGDGSSQEHQVAAAMERLDLQGPVAALVTTGDNLYGGDVDAAWNVPFGWVAYRGIPVYAAWGNHDLESEPRRRAVAAALHPPDRWYAVDLGTAALVVLDANRPSDPEQLAWLDATLAARSSRPLLVAFHQPAFSCALHGSTPAVIREWVPRFERAAVDLVLSGHDHAYQRFEQQGITYVVTGGGGGVLYDIGDCPDGTPHPVAGNDRAHHFVVVEIAGDRIVVEALTPEGETIDRTEIVVNRSTVPPPL